MRYRLACKRGGEIQYFHAHVPAQVLEGERYILAGFLKNNNTARLTDAECDLANQDVECARQYIQKTGCQQQW